jgi:hypothetical protein
MKQKEMSKQVTMNPSLDNDLTVTIVDGVFTIRKKVDT